MRDVGAQIDIHDVRGGLLRSVFTAPAIADQRVAMVIGNASYAHAPVLASPLNDAAKIAAALGRLGFAVTRVENAGYAALRRSLQQFASSASASEVALVFYTGHTIQVDQSNFLVPVDARLLSDGDVEFETVPLALVLRAVERAPGLRLIILDTSRRSPFAASMQRAGATRSIGRGLARVEPSSETLLAYAAKAGTLASEDARRNSPYSAALLRHLEEPGLGVSQMFRKVRKTVLATTNRRQEPIMYGSLSNRRPSLAPRPEVAPAQDLAAERELLFWQSVKDSDNPWDLRAYLDRYPNGAFAVLARNRLNRLTGTAGEAVEAALGLERAERLRIQECCSARGSDADRHAKPLMSFDPEGSNLRAEQHHEMFRMFDALIVRSAPLYCLFPDIGDVISIFRNLGCRIGPRIRRE